MRRRETCTTSKFLRASDCCRHSSDNRCSSKLSALLWTHSRWLTGPLLVCHTNSLECHGGRINALYLFVYIIYTYFFIRYSLVTHAAKEAQTRAIAHHHHCLHRDGASYSQIKASPESSQTHASLLHGVAGFL